MDTKTTNLQLAIKLMGGVSQAQKVLGLNTYQSIQQWIKTRVPAEYCPRIEKVTNGAVRCEDLRPDVDWAFLRSTDCPIEKLGAGGTAADHPSEVS